MQLHGSYPLTVQAPNYVVLTGIKVAPKNGSGSITKWFIEGSNDGTNYTTIYNNNSLNISSETTITITNTKAYKYFRMYANDTSITEINFVTGTTITRIDDILLTLSASSLSAYYDGLKVSIKVPSTYTSTATNLTGYLNINSIGQKALPSDLTSSEYVELVYNGTSFIKR